MARSGPLRRVPRGCVARAKRRAEDRSSVLRSCSVPPCPRASVCEVCAVPPVSSVPSVSDPPSPILRLRSSVSDPPLTIPCVGCKTVARPGPADRKLSQGPPFGAGALLVSHPHLHGLFDGCIDRSSPFGRPRERGARRASSVPRARGDVRGHAVPQRLPDVPRGADDRADGAAAARRRGGRLEHLPGVLPGGPALRLCVCARRYNAARPAATRARPRGRGAGAPLPAAYWSCGRDAATYTESGRLAAADPAHVDRAAILRAVDERRGAAEVVFRHG